MRITIKMMAVVVMVMLVVLVMVMIMVKMRKVTQQICPGSDIYFPPKYRKIGKEIFSERKYRKKSEKMQKKIR